MKIRELLWLPEIEIYRYFKNSDPSRLLGLFNLEGPEIYVDPVKDILRGRKIIKKSGIAIIYTEELNLQVQPSSVKLIGPGRTITVVFMKGKLDGLIIKDSKDNKTICRGNLLIKTTDTRYYYPRDES